MKLGKGVELVQIPDFSGITEQQKVHWTTLIAALRSNKYEQVMGQLRSEKGFCCLGVAQDLVKTDLGLFWIRQQEEAGYALWNPKNKYHDKSDLDWAKLAEPARDLYGFNSLSGFTVTAAKPFHGTCYHTLVSLNDYGVTFSKIADVLEVAMNGGFDKLVEGS